MNPKPEEYKWILGPCPDLFQRVTNEYLEVGGGSAAAIALDNEFHYGLTQTSSTFLNPPLTANLKEHFECMALEVWGFT